MGVTAILVAYAVGSITLPVVWDRRHPQTPIRRPVTPSSTDTMRQRGRA